VAVGQIRLHPTAHSNDARRVHDRLRSALLELLLEKAGDKPPRYADQGDPMGERRTRVVDRLVIHGEPISFRELCQRAVPEETRYLILDLDRTVHLGRNMGELLGWELCAHQGYGLDRLREVEAWRAPGRFFLDWRRPASMLRYLAITARTWALPGLFYLFCGKLPAHLEFTRRTLLARYPDLADRGVVSVGISDTGYGEDHCWAEHFTRVSTSTVPPPSRPSSPPRHLCKRSTPRGRHSRVRTVRILEPLPTEGLSSGNVRKLRDDVRDRIARAIDGSESPVRMKRSS
jgi:hypothetical protein